MLASKLRLLFAPRLAQMVVFLLLFLRSDYQGMNKMVVNHLDKLFVTSDAATIIRELEVSLVFSFLFFCIKDAS